MKEKTNGTVIDPSCTQQGYTSHKCEICGDEYQDSFTAALGHEFGEWATVIEATCMETGSQERMCERCGETETEIIPASGHQYGDWISDGKKKHKIVCSLCGMEEMQMHTWGEPVITKEAASRKTINRSFGRVMSSAEH